MKFINFKWLFFRIKNEITFPTTYFGKKIMFFILKLFFLRKKKYNGNIYMVAVYDLNVNPITYNFGEFLVLCNNEIRKKNLCGYKVIFIAKKYQTTEYNVLKNTEYENIVDEDSQKWRFNNILLPLLYCAENYCIGYEYLTYKEDIKKYDKNTIFFPENYNTKINVVPNLLDLHKISSLEKVGLTAPLQSKNYIREYFKQNNINKKVITVTIRYQKHDPSRNSDLDSWLEFCSYIESLNFKVIVIPDTDQAWLLKKKFQKFEVFMEGAFNILLLIGLYECAFYNYFTAHGPSILSCLNNNTKYIGMKMGPIKGSTVHTKQAFTYLKPNSNYLFTDNKDHILVWKEDNLYNLKESFNKYVLLK